MTSLLLSNISYSPWISVRKYTKYTYEGYISANWRTKLNLTDLLESNDTCLTYLMFNFETSPRSEAELIAFGDYENLTKYLKGFTAWHYLYTATRRGYIFVGLLIFPYMKHLYLLIKNVGNEGFDYFLEVRKWVICAKGLLSSESVKNSNHTIHIIWEALKTCHPLVGHNVKSHLLFWDIKSCRVRNGNCIFIRK